MYSNYGTDNSVDEDGDYYGPGEVYDPVQKGPTPNPNHSTVNENKFQDFEGLPPSKPPPSPSQLNTRQPHILPSLNPIQTCPDRDPQLGNRESTKYMSPLELQASRLILGKPLEDQHIYGNDDDPEVQKYLGQSNSQPKKEEGIELQNLGEQDKSQANPSPDQPRASGCTFKKKVCLIIVGILLTLASAGVAAIGILTDGKFNNFDFLKLIAQPLGEDITTKKPEPVTLANPCQPRFSGPNCDQCQPGFTGPTCETELLKVLLF